MKPAVARVWTFGSSSNSAVEYETLQYLDGSTSCNCPGWTRRTTADGHRSCKHTRAVDLKRADQLCTATHTYHNQPIQHAQTKTKSPQLGHRRITV